MAIEGPRGSGGGGGGWALGPATNTFNAATQAAAITARNTYATNNASWLADYDANPLLLVRLTWPTTPTSEAFYARINSAWVNVTAALSQKGDKGDTGPTGLWQVEIFQAAATAPAAPTAYSLTDAGVISGLDGGWLAEPPATLADSEGLWVRYAIVVPSSHTFPITSGLVWSAAANIRGQQGIRGLRGYKGNTGNKGDKGDTGNTGPRGPTQSAGQGLDDEGTTRNVLAWDDKYNPYIVLKGLYWAGLSATLEPGHFQHVNAGDNSSLRLKLPTDEKFPSNPGDKVRIENEGDTEWMMGILETDSTLSDADGATLVLNFADISYGDESAFNVAVSTNWRFVRIAYVRKGETVDPHSGTTLPSSPALGQLFVLTQDDGSNTEGTYECLTAGTWSKIASGGGGGGGNAAAESTQAQAEAGTGGNDTRMTPRRTKQAIVALEQKNPKHVVNFRTEDNDGAIAGATYFIKSDNTQWQSGSTNDISAVEIHHTQFDLTQNPIGATDTPANTDWHSLPQDIVDNKGATIWDFYRMGSGVVVPSTPTFRLRAGTIAKNDDGNYVLQNLKVLRGWNWSGSTGVNWQVAGVFAPYSPADGIVGVVEKDNLPDDVVYTEELVGKETDRYASYGSAFLAASYRRGAFTLYNQSSGAPQNANEIGQPDIANGDVVMAVSTFLRTDRDPDNLVWADENTVADYPSGRVLEVSIWNRPAASYTATLTGAGTLVGAGDAAYIWFPCTLSGVTDATDDVADNGNYFRIANEEPTLIPARWPASDILGLATRIAALVTPAGDPITGETKLMLANLTGLSIDHLERHFADRYQSFGNFSIVVSSQYDAKGEIDASQLTNANKKIRLALPDALVADFGTEIVNGALVELYEGPNDYVLGRVDSVTNDSLRTAINGRYVNLTTLEIVGSVGAGDTVEFRHYVQGDGLVTVPTGDDTGRTLEATGVNAYDWKTPLNLHVAASGVSGTASAILITGSPALEEYRAGQRLTFESKGSPTGNTTVNVDTLGVKTIFREDGTTIQTGDILNGNLLDLIYDGIGWILLNRHKPVPYAGTRFVKTLTGVNDTASTFLTAAELATIGNNDLIHGQIYETADNWKTYPFSFKKDRATADWRWFAAADDSGGYTSGSRYQWRLNSGVIQIQEQGSGPATATVDIYVTPVA